jgi:hypothetical protein
LSEVLGLDGFQDRYNRMMFGRWVAAFDDAGFHSLGSWRGQDCSGKGKVADHR